MRQYEVVRNGNRGAFVGLLFNFPRIDLDRIQVLTSDQTEDAFKSRRAGEINLSP